MRAINNPRDGVSVLFIVAAVITFGLAAFGAHIGSLSELDLDSIGLAFFAASFLL